MIRVCHSGRIDSVLNFASPHQGWGRRPTCRSWHAGSGKIPDLATHKLGTYTVQNLLRAAAQLRQFVQELHARVRHQTAFAVALMVRTAY